MLSPESNELQAYIDELIEETRLGNFQWESVNPTTYIWQRIDQNGAGARLSLQRLLTRTKFSAGRSVPELKYHLQVTEINATEGPIDKLRISGSADDELNKRLERLFRLVKSGVTKDGLDFFKSLLKAKTTGR